MFIFAEIFLVALVVKLVCQVLARRGAAIQVKQLHQIDDRFPPIQPLLLLLGERVEHPGDIDRSPGRKGRPLPYRADRSRSAQAQQAPSRFRGFLGRHKLPNLVRSVLVLSDSGRMPFCATFLGHIGGLAAGANKNHHPKPVAGAEIRCLNQ